MNENAQRLVTETGINDARRLGATALRAGPALREDMVTDDE